MRFKYYLRGAGIGVIAATLILSIAFLFQDHISDEEVIRRAIELGMVMEGEESPSGSGTLADMQQSGASSVDLETGADDAADGTNGSGTGGDMVPDGGEDVQDIPGQDSTSEPNPDAGENNNSNQIDPDTEGLDQNDPDSNNSDNSDNLDKKDSEAEGSNNKASGTKGSGKGNSDNKGADIENSDSKESDKKDSDQKGADSDGSDQKDSDSDKPNRRPSGNTATVTIESGDVSRIVSAKVFEAGLVDSADEFNSYLGEHGYANLLQPGTYEINKDATFRQIALILTKRQ